MQFEPNKSDFSLTFGKVLKTSQGLFWTEHGSWVLILIFVSGTLTSLHCSSSESSEISSNSNSILFLQSSKAGRLGYWMIMWIIKNYKRKNFYHTLHFWTNTNPRNVPLYFSETGDYSRKLYSAQFLVVHDICSGRYRRSIFLNFLWS